MPKSKEFVESSSSDSNSDSEQKKSRKKKRPSEDDKGASSKKSKKESEQEPEELEWDLGNNRRVQVRDFKGKLLVDIREMYLDKSGDLKPGKKGIALTMSQWQKFMDVVKEVDKVAKSKS